jgi:phosphoribosylaminoimidazolecarboxamide formyltransferase/IMP cyclohydrolase
VKRALLSVTHKDGIAELARRLARLGVEIISTGGTAKLLREEGVKVTLLEEYTGSPEMLDGRVKTLHPKVHGGILARRDLQSHKDEAEKRGIPMIDLVAVNLYDFDGAVKKPSATFDEILENIDIGGPTLLRASAKNHAHVIPLIDPSDYGWILDRLEAGQEISSAERKQLALKVYTETSRYDRAVSSWLSDHAKLSLELERVQELRYGENPHQTGAFFRPSGEAPRLLAAAKQLQGKELSYNNILDLDSAFGLVVDLSSTVAGASCVYVKHNNPCGVAVNAHVKDAIAAARAADAVSAFGGVVAVNVEVDEDAAKVLTETFLEAIIAPSYSSAALAVFEKKANVRVLVLDRREDWSGVAVSGTQELRQVRGGFLVQSRDAVPKLAAELEASRVVTKRAPTEDERKALAFTWAVAKHVRSNAIVFGTADRTVAVGAGQMSRVDSVKICRMKAGDALRGTAVASDAFFPFRDGLDVLADAGATAVVQPGGSIRDEEVIRAADEHGVAMIFTGVRHFRH